MGNDDFFGGGSDRTVLRPNPGGRRPSNTQQMQAVNQTLPTLPGNAPSDTNPLLSAATPLLSLATQLRGSASHPDSQSLFNELAKEIQKFEQTAKSGGARPEGVLAGRYLLCTLLDEIVLSTPWGHQSSWSSRTLLNAFHNEGWGGEKCFQVLDRVKLEPAKNINLLELFYTCIALGFEGKWRVHDRGRSELDNIQNDLYRLIAQHRGEHESDLSPRWRGVTDLRTPLAKYVPLWVVASVAAGVMALIYFGFLLMLNKESDPVAVEIAALGRNLAPLVEREAYVPPPRRLTLAELLSAEITLGELEVREDLGASSVILKGDGLFASGSDRVADEKLAILGRIGEALNQIEGQVLVTGHTDNVPIRSIRFPSNWHLSKARAESVSDILGLSVDSERITAEPRSSNEPLVDNDSAVNRARNRRVEITLFATPGRE